jgi:5-methylcytosine-specific restriction endonuclease McrA
MPRIPTLRPGIPVLNGRSVQIPKQVNPHYQRPEHVAWSRQVKERAHWACERCGRTGDMLFADHIREIRDGGTWDLSNGQALCGSCHTAKTMVERAKRAFQQHGTKP